MALRSEVDPRILIYAVIGFFAGLFLMYAGFGLFKRKRLIENLPTSKIRSIAMGLVEVNGKARHAKEKVMTSPLSGKKCVYYKYTIEKYVSSGKSGHWRMIKYDVGPGPFFVEDNTGTVLVDPKKADIKVPMSYQSQSSWGKDPEPLVKKFLEKEKIKFEGALFGANFSMRYREWIIPPGMELYVLGEAKDNPYVEEGTAVHGVEDIMITKGKDKIMMISHGKEKQVLKSLKWKAFGGLIGGLVLSVVCLVITLAYISNLGG